MGEKNNVINVYMNRPERIKSILEYHLKEKLPDDWEMHCNEASRFYSVKNVNSKLTSRERDIYKKIETETEKFYLGIENQYNINLIFPWRLMQMDCLAYEKQIEEIKERNGEKKVDFGKVDDFLYQYKETDRILPVLNLVLYWGEDEWEKPLQLSDRVDMNGISEKGKRFLGKFLKVR